MTTCKQPDLPALPAPDLATLVAAGSASTEQVRELTDQLDALVARAEQGDRDALLQAAALCKADPQLWPAANVLQHTAEQSVLDALAGPDGQLFAREVIQRQMEQLRCDLTGEDATPLERLLVDHVVLCWLHVLSAFIVLAQHEERGCPPWQGEYIQRRAERAQRQYLRATKTLATIRRLGAPTVQVNVAKQQINVADSRV